MTFEAVDAFEDSRRLTGPNLFFAACGAVLDTAPGIAVDAVREAAWRSRLDMAFDALAWRAGPRAVRRHASGAQLAIGAPIDQLLTATSVNEWAWQDALGLPWRPDEESDNVVSDRALALALLGQRAALERQPALVALARAAGERHLPFLFDDELVSVGSGRGVQRWPLTALPAPQEVPWPRVHGVPAVLVTGSNGKTTTARLLSAIARAAGVHAGHCCTDGLYVDGQRFEAGDYSGPAGARAILRDPRVDLAVLETARGGILRRGLALAQADAAIVTNVSPDHFGEYGIHDLQGLADTKLVVARAVDHPGGMLVLNADDPVLAARTPVSAGTIAWFALADDHPRLARHREQGGATCGVRGGRMHLVHPARRIDVDLGDVAAMPLTLGGHAPYNVANLLGAALAAAALGLPADAMRATFARFGAARGDNPGRLARWTIAGIRVILDYAHNPEGLHGLLAAATAEPYKRLVLVLGQAGNRADAEIRALADTAASFRPAYIVLKDIAGMERGRAAGEAAALLFDELQQRGVAPDTMAFVPREADAALEALALADEGDLVVLPIHGSAARTEVETLLDEMSREEA